MLRLVFVGKNHSATGILAALGLTLICTSCTVTDRDPYEYETKHSSAFSFIPKKSSLEKELTHFINNAEPDAACTTAQLRDEEAIPLSRDSVRKLRRNAVKYWEKVLPEDTQTKNKLLKELEQTVHVQMVNIHQSLDATGLDIAQKGNHYVLNTAKHSTRMASLRGKRGIPVPVMRSRAMFASGVPIPKLRNHASQFATLKADKTSQGGPFVSVDDFAARYKQISQNLYQLAALKKIHQAIPLGMPMQKARKTSEFGPRRDPFNRRRAYHTGIDFSAQGTPPVYTTARGKVIFAGWKSGYGNTVIIDHGLGLTTRYAHLSSLLVKNGQKIDDRSTIGYQGSTGRSTGNHLHYEIRLHDKPIHPKRFIQAGQSNCGTADI